MTTPSYKCSNLPTPPEAITGIDTALDIAPVNSKSYPSSVPSRSKLVTRSSPAPNDSHSFAHFIASLPVPVVPDLTTTSKPEATSLFRRASIATTIFSFPKRSEASAIKRGLLTAAVLIAI